jgi:hypothetical protein
VPGGRTTTGKPVTPTRSRQSIEVTTSRRDTDRVAAPTIITVDATAIVRHFELVGVDNDAAAEDYTVDAILEYVQSNERIRGRDNIIASRRAYPGRPTHFSVYRCMKFGATAAVELVMYIQGDQPHPVVAIVDLHGDAISRERIYIADPWPAPEYRASWVEPITRST